MGYEIRTADGVMVSSGSTVWTIKGAARSVRHEDFDNAFTRQKVQFCYSTEKAAAEARVQEAKTRLERIDAGRAKAVKELALADKQYLKATKADS